MTMAIIFSLFPILVRVRGTPAKIHAFWGAIDCFENHEKIIIPRDKIENMSDGRSDLDFFCKYAAISAFIGFIIFSVFVLVSIQLYPFGWDPFDDAFSTTGEVRNGNYAAGFLPAALALGSGLMTPVLVLYLIQVKRNFKEYKQFNALLGFTLKIIGMGFMVLVAAFPTQPWGKTHDYIAVLWLAGELFGLLFISFAMLAGKKGEKKDRLWGFIPFILIVVAIVFWIPYILETWDGIAIPEIASVLALYSYNIALWIRAYMGNISIGRARQS
ncbi:DUF998 domain-containing protein [Candidatus Bathyarchaeota archaeon]|nr:DUF998 domain-containing protein [Candidatus Bathyarchaeota archaeon]